MEPTNEQLELIEVMSRTLGEEFTGTTEADAQEWLDSHWTDFIWGRKLEERKKVEIR